MRISIEHDIEASVGAVEQAVVSRALAARFAAEFPAFESIDVARHEVSEGVLRRVWRFQARAPLPVMRPLRVARDMMTWDEHFTYRLADHAGEWHVVPRPNEPADAPWRRRFHAAGSYRLEARSAGRTRRIVAGELDVRLDLFGAVIERAALAELGKAYAAEALAVRALCPPG